ncbi:MAG: YbaY family lipoprotein [Candidatus Obscuribacterales bacterium]|nr:YbaY family lipoprotein [Candidatus Obscuribacterales bacterium]
MSDTSQSTQEVLILRRPKVQVRGQLYIGGGPLPSLDGAKLTVQIADTSLLDAAADVLVETTVDVPKGHSSNWLKFELKLDWAGIKGRNFLPVASLALLARIEDAADKLLYRTKVHHNIDLSNEVLRLVQPTVVVEPV